MPYISPEVILEAKQIDLLTYLKACEPSQLVRVSGNTYCTKEHDSLKISNGKWMWWSRGIGGKTALDYLIKVQGYSFLEAVQAILGNTTVAYPVMGNVQKEEARAAETPLLLPEKCKSADKVTEYLFGRGIDYEIINYCLQKGFLFESLPYHNAVFVGYDEHGIARHAHKRGTGSESTYKGNAESCDPRYSFHWTGKDNTLYLFEAPIDMLSFISLHKENWRSHSYAAACCVGDQVLFQMLKVNPNIDTVCLCMDNDTAGQAANKRISDKLFIQGIKHEILVPEFKDWNEDRLAAGGNAPHIRAEFSLPQEESEEEEVCQTLQL